MAQQIANKVDLEQMDLLQAFEKIVDMAKNSSLSEKFYQKADAYLGFVSEKLGISKRASVIMSLFADKCNNRIRLSDYLSYLDCRILTLLRYLDEIKQLEDKEYICIHKDDDAYYTVPMEVMESFLRNKPYMPVEAEELTTLGFFEECDNLFSKCRLDKLSPQLLFKRLRALAVRNSRLKFFKTMQSYRCDIEDDVFPLFICFCTNFVLNSDDDIGYGCFSFMYDVETPEWRMVKRELSLGTHLFFQNNFIENTMDDGFVNKDTFKITDDAKAKLFSDLNLSFLQVKRLKREMISCNGIKEKALFYNSGEKKQVQELTSLLEESHYQQIRQRLRKSNFRTGFASLFYGAPGTGKTETVFQIAKKTGRDVIQLNISSVRSMYVGESEKNIKGLFENYKKKVKQCDKAPILLFNEADAVIGRRMAGAERAIDKMENSLQNVILQEMEQLDGILIATTNLAGNMDEAFERRFLYKIKFEKPDVGCRTKIWQAMIPSLTVSDASYLADKYDFCGGEIENIARHYTIQSILHGKPTDLLGSLTEFCDTERLKRTKIKKKVGF